jgi:regulator of protease activity HflC (stomatin/prohibitin superfamily)
MGELGSCGAVVCFIVLIVSVGLFGGSFKTIDPLHAGLRKNTISNAIDPQVYISGRYFLGLTYDFVTYPTTLQNVNFDTGSPDYGAVSVATAGSSTVTLSVSFQYRLRIVELQDLYFKYGEDAYHAQIITQAVEAVKAVAQTYTITDYFEKRQVIGEAMHVECNSELWDDYAVVEHFQLRMVTPPSATETEILNKIIAQQDVIIAGVEQESALILAESERFIAEAEADVVVTEALAFKEAELLIGNATAQRITTHLNASAVAFSNLGATIGYNSSQLLSHMALEHIRTLDQSNTNLVVDLPSALFSV